MAKLSREQMKRHKRAEEILRKDRLTFEEAWTVYEDWHPGAEHMTGDAGIFFTPALLARDFALEVCGERIIDLCAGIGVLSFMSRDHAYEGRGRGFVCIERNPAFVEIGKKLLPEATWVCGDVTDAELIKSLGHFDYAIGNPPFGKIKTGQRRAPRYTGAEFELQVIDIASDIADQGVFIIPQGSTPFRYSGTQFYEEVERPRYEKFRQQTGIPFYFNCGIDTSFYADDWQDAKPCVEIVCPDFEQARQDRAPLQRSLFAA